MEEGRSFIIHNVVDLRSGVDYTCKACDKAATMVLCILYMDKEPDSEGKRDVGRCYVCEEHLETMKGKQTAFAGFLDGEM